MCAPSRLRYARADEVATLRGAAVASTDESNRALGHPVWGRRIQVLWIVFAMLYQGVADASKVYPIFQERIWSTVLILLAGCLVAAMFLHSLRMPWGDESRGVLLVALAACTYSIGSAVKLGDYLAAAFAGVWSLLVAVLAWSRRPADGPSETTLRIFLLFVAAIPAGVVGLVATLGVQHLHPRHVVVMYPVTAAPLISVVICSNIGLLPRAGDEARDTGGRWLFWVGTLLFLLCGAVLGPSRIADVTPATGWTAVGVGVAVSLLMILFVSWPVAAVARQVMELGAPLNVAKALLMGVGGAIAGVVAGMGEWVVLVGAGGGPSPGDLVLVAGLSGGIATLSAILGFRVYRRLLAEPTDATTAQAGSSEKSNQPELPGLGGPDDVPC